MYILSLNANNNSMKPTLNLYSENNTEIKKFLEKYYSKNFDLGNNMSYKEEFGNPIDMIDIISCLIDNNDKYNIAIWISVDKDIYICVTSSNLDNIIKYLYERYPY